MPLNRLIATMIALVLLCSPAHAFRVEGFKWGETRSSVLKTLEKRGWPVEDAGTKRIIKTEAFLRDEVCKIRFGFDDSLKLRTIRVVWDTTTIIDNE